MERLTFEGNFCDISKCAEVGFWPECKTDGCSQKQVWERLKWFEDLEEQGRLVILPCRVGDTVYDISEFVDGCPYPEMYEFTADYVGIGKSEDGRTVITIDSMDYYMDDFGKTVFLSRPEAEAALAASGKEG